MGRPGVSSGDLLTDRRYAIAQELLQLGDAAGAGALLEVMVQRSPNWAAGHILRGRALERAFDRQGAIAAYRRALALDPLDVGGASLALAQIDPMATVDIAPPDYVQSLFDSYADTFDDALVSRLNYTTPTALAAALDAMFPGRKYASALDLGCGTGLSGMPLRHLVSWLVGVDLSSGMIAQAREKAIYDDLITADIVSHLAANDRRFGLVCATDVFIYFGDLVPVFRSIAPRLEKGGVLIFSVEECHVEGYRVSESLRFAHAATYVRSALDAAGLAVRHLDRCILRKDRGTDVQGMIFLAQPAADVATTQANAQTVFPENEQADPLAPLSPRPPT